MKCGTDPACLGKTIATQNLMDNLGMLFAGLFAFVSVKMDLTSSQVFLGLAFVVFMIVLWLRFPKASEPGKSPSM